MPNKIQARTDDMAPTKKNSQKALTSIILFAVFAISLGLIAFAKAIFTVCKSSTPYT